MSQTTLELKNGLKFYVSGQEITLALQQVNVSFKQGEIVAITGESGSGKSTLAHVLAGIFPCDQGELFLNGISQQQNEEKEWGQYRRTYISFVAQNYGILPGNTVFDNVISTLLLAGMKKTEAKKRASYLLKEVDLWKLRRRKAGKLSSGQKQRLSVARAIAKPAPILIADEPTSNLDWRFASKIIKLLAAEASQRLVIVVTHNFEVIQDYVTRNLVLKDGEIIEDSFVLQQQEQQTVSVEKETQTMAVKVSKVKKGRLSAYIAGLQTKARPVWTALMVLFFSLTAFAVFAFLGSFIAAWDDTNTKQYSSELFLNGSDKRLVVVRQDGERMTEEDYTKLLTVPWIAGIERYGVLSDINYHYREGVDYIYEIDSDGGGFDKETTYEEIPVLLESDAFLQTVPIMREGEEFLKAGRLPMHFDEVVAAGSAALVGTAVDVYFHDKDAWADGFYVKETMEIVGVTDYGSGLFFDDRVGILFWQAEALEAFIGSLHDVRLYYFVNETAGNGFYASKLLSNRWYERAKYYQSFPHYLANPKTGEYVEMNYNLVEVPMVYYIGISESTFDAMAYERSCYEISVFLEDYAYTDRTMEALKEMGYESLSPYRFGSRIQDGSLSKQRLNTLMVCMMALLVVVVAQVVVLSAMYGTQMESFVQLRNLGLPYKIGRTSLWLQVLGFATLGQLIGSGMIVWGAVYEISFLVELIKFLSLWHMVVLSLVHLGISVLLAVVVCRMLRRKAYSYVLENQDVDLAELDEDREGGMA